MTKFIKLTTTQFGLAKYVNPDWVCEIGEYPYGNKFQYIGSTLAYHDGVQITVQETPEQIIALIDANTVNSPV